MSHFISSMFSEEEAQTNQPLRRSSVSIGQNLVCGSGRRRVHQDLGVASAGGHVPRIHALQFREADGRLHFCHAVVPADHVVDVGKFLFQFGKIQALLHIVTVIAKTSRRPAPRSSLSVVTMPPSPPVVKVLFWQRLPSGFMSLNVPGFLAFVDAAERFGVVFDYEQIVLLGEGANFVHVGDIAVKNAPA